MHFSSLLISSFLLAPVVLAGHPREFRRSLVEKRTDAVSDVVLGNYAGASWVQDEGTFQIVSANITVPELLGQNDSPGIGIAWVGIDASPGVCDIAFQAGITFEFANGPAYSAWYQWYPGEVQVFADAIGTTSPGDLVEISFMTLLFSNTSGHVIFKNHSKNLSSTLPVQSDHALCLKSAEWIVQVEATPLLNFGTITFKDAMAAGNNGDIYHPLGAIIYDINVNDQTLTSVRVDDNSVTVKYTGT